MDVDKIMKINNLSKELQRHGIASSRAEAVEQARVAVEETPGNESEPVLLVQEQPPAKSSLLQERRFELLLEMNNRKYDQELAALRTMISSLSTQLEQMRLEFKTLGERQLQASVPKKVDKQEVLKTETKENHPRQGSFKPGDETVAIDKIFYFGTGGPKV